MAGLRLIRLSFHYALVQIIVNPVVLLMVLVVVERLSRRLGTLELI